MKQLPRLGAIGIATVVLASACSEPRQEDEIPNDSPSPAPTVVTPTAVEQCIQDATEAVTANLRYESVSDFALRVGAESVTFDAAMSALSDPDIVSIREENGVSAAITAAQPILVNACALATDNTPRVVPETACGMLVLVEFESFISDRSPANTGLADFGTEVGFESVEFKALTRIISRTDLSAALLAGGYREAINQVSHTVDDECLANGADQDSSNLPSPDVSGGLDVHSPNTRSPHPRESIQQATALPEQWATLPEGVFSCHEVVYYYANLISGDPDAAEEIVRLQFGGRASFYIAEALRMAAVDDETRTDPSAVAERVCTIDGDTLP